MSGNPGETQREQQAAPAVPSDVFVSYSSQDAGVASAMVEALEARGIGCWIAPRDVKAGAQYADVIVRAITGARALVLVLSEHAMASPHVSREIERAASKRRLIFAVRVDAAPLTPAFEYFLSESQWIEAQTGTMTAAFARLIDAIVEPEDSARKRALPLIAGSVAAGTLAGQRQRRRNGMLLVAGVAAATVAVAALFAPTFWHAKHVIAQQSTVVAASPVNARSIAVLPFANRSTKQDDAYFSDGIQDDILTQLAKISSMTVIARTSVERFRNTRLSTREIGRKLGVARVLEGGVQRAGDRVHVTVQLIDAATDSHLWAESYDRKLTVANIFSIQREISTAVTRALQVTLTQAEQAGLRASPAQNLDAWEAYQLGRQRAANRTGTGLAEAEKFLRRAIALDPKFAPAYASLAETLVMQVDYSDAPAATTVARAQQAVNTALRLDPNLAEAWASSAAIAEFSDQDVRAEQMFRRAIALNPNYATAYWRLSAMLTFMGRANEALSLAERAVALDPLSAIVNSNLGWCLEALGRFDAAEARFRKVIEIDPTMPRSYWDLGGFSAYALNRFADAVLFLEKGIALDSGHPYSISLAEVYMDLDEDQAAQMIRAAKKEDPDNWPTLSSTLHLYRGEEEAAVQDARRVLAKYDPQDAHALRLLRDADALQGQDVVAHARYAKAYPEFFAVELPKIGLSNWRVAIDLVPVLQRSGAGARANELLDRTEKFIRTMTRLGGWGYGIADVEIYALRGQKREALVALRAAERAGWRESWRYYRDFDPDFAAIRNEPEFRAVFVDIERDMARQRAELAARLRKTPPNPKATSN